MFLLHLKYKLFVCEPKIKFKNLPGAKALATDHRACNLLLCDQSMYMCLVDKDGVVIIACLKLLAIKC